MEKVPESLALLVFCLLEFGTYSHIFKNERSIQAVFRCQVVQKVRLGRY